MGHPLTEGETTMSDTPTEPVDWPDPADDPDEEPDEDWAKDDDAS